MNVQPYVFFDGKCEEALEFYKGAIGAKVDMMMRFSESPDKPPARHDAARLGEQGDARRASRSATRRSWPPTAIAPASRPSRASRSPSTRRTTPRPTSCSTPSARAARSRCRSTKTFFASKFGMVTDRFGVLWIVIAGSEGECQDRSALTIRSLLRHQRTPLGATAQHDQTYH